MAKRIPPGADKKAREHLAPVAWKADFLVLARLIHARRKAAGMTQVEAGALIGVSDRTYRAFENGYGDISARRVFMLAAKLGIRIFDGNRKNSSDIPAPGGEA